MAVVNINTIRLTFPFFLAAMSFRGRGGGGGRGRGFRGGGGGGRGGGGRGGESSCHFHCCSTSLFLHILTPCSYHA